MWARLWQSELWAGPRPERGQPRAVKVEASGPSRQKSKIHPKSSFRLATLHHSAKVERCLKPFFRSLRPTKLHLGLRDGNRASHAKAPAHCSCSQAARGWRAGGAKLRILRNVMGASPKPMLGVPDGMRRDRFSSSTVF